MDANIDGSPNGKGGRIMSRTVWARVAVMLVAAGVLAATAARAATATWSSGWSGGGGAGGIPLSTDDVSILGGDLVWNTSLPSTVASWTQDAGYTGKVTFNTMYAGATGDTGFNTFTVTNGVSLNGGTWAHADNSTAQAYRLHVSAGSLNLASGASINVTGLGYDLGNGPGSPGTLSRAGGSYGGEGGYSVSGDGTVKAPYGSYIAPADLGSGGGRWGGGVGTAGGGAVFLEVAGAMTLNGSIVADGAAGNPGECASGSGGSVYIRAGSLNGTTGSVTANGNFKGSTSGAGGGGRIAVVLDTGTSTDAVTFAAYGGPGGPTAGRTAAPAPPARSTSKWPETAPATAS